MLKKNFMRELQKYISVISLCRMMDGKCPVRRVRFSEGNPFREVMPEGLTAIKKMSSLLRYASNVSTQNIFLQNTVRYILTLFSWIFAGICIC